MIDEPIYGSVRADGQGLSLEPVQRARLKQWAGAEIEIRKKRLTRSEKANRYYWGVVLALIASSQEMTPEDVHDAMCEQFLPNERKRVEFFNRMTGEVVAAVETDGRRSSKLTGGPFYDFVERVRLWAVEFLGVVTPDPDPEYWRKRGARGD